MSSLKTRNEILSHLRNVLDTRNKRQEKEDDETQQQSADQNVLDDDKSYISIPSTSAVDEPEEEVDEENAARRQLAPFRRTGTIVFEDNILKVIAVEVSHKRYSRFNVGDHLYALNFRVKAQNPPLLLDIQNALNQAIIQVLDKLKTVYPQDEHFQVYLTIISQEISNGLNSGNYSLKTPSPVIARWMTSMLYHFLKSNQTIRLNNTFHIKVKVLSVAHTNHLIRRKTSFQKHVPKYH